MILRLYLLLVASLGTSTIATAQTADPDIIVRRRGTIDDSLWVGGDGQATYRGGQGAPRPGFWRATFDIREIRALQDSLAKDDCRLEATASDSRSVTPDSANRACPVVICERPCTRVVYQTTGGLKTWNPWPRAGGEELDRLMASLLRHPAWKPQP